MWLRLRQILTGTVKSSSLRTNLLYPIYPLLGCCSFQCLIGTKFKTRQSYSLRSFASVTFDRQTQDSVISDFSTVTVFYANVDSTTVAGFADPGSSTTISTSCFTYKTIKVIVLLDTRLSWPWHYWFHDSFCRPYYFIYLFCRLVISLATVSVVGLLVIWITVTYVTYDFHSSSLSSPFVFFNSIYIQPIKTISFIWLHYICIQARFFVVPNFAIHRNFSCRLADRSTHQAWMHRHSEICVHPIVHWPSVNAACCKIQMLGLH